MMTLKVHLTKEGLEKIIQIKSGNTTRFSVTRHKDIEKILDIFTKYPLNCTKLLNFFDFKKAFELYTSSKIKGENIAQQINDLKYIPESDLEDGGLRMLEVDNRVILPELTHVRFIVTAADVIHKKWA
ncbi:cytochrome c oxidase subunit 2 (mitochondrion) protein [Rutstroemia sp. NJR-2017a BBW]|nr:cytochrome c oxidase subunit 2 (mitochondrion) protein [Rutstroemia sp. NJR-2017a BBW]